MKNKIIVIIGIILVVAGFAKSGLWPWQLPAVMVGTFMTLYGFEYWKKL
jgi:uncharacterized membrane protein